MTLLEQCQIWHAHDEFQKIIEAIDAVPAAERTPELDSELARAYNNAASVDDRAYFEKAIALLTPHADYFKGDHLWNFRMGYAYYYLDREDRALPHFEAALAALPGDPDTEKLIESCHKGLALPLFQRPFRIRVQEAWAVFAQEEAELRALMDAGEDHGEELIERCSDVLRIALSDVSFEMGKGGAARAVLWGLFQAGAAEIVIGVRNPQKARPLAEEFSRYGTIRLFEWHEESFRHAVRAAELVVNATSLGMAPEIEASPPIPWEEVQPGTFFYDIIYTPAETSFLRRAAAQGCPVLNGEGMLVGQGAAAFKLWTGKTADFAVMAEALRGALERGRPEKPKPER